jgi:hypothetical protein
VINNGLPSQPGLWPPRPPSRPTYPVDPNYDIPVGEWPAPPVITWPPPQPVYPSLPIYIRPPHVGGGPMPGRPGHVGGGPTFNPVSTIHYRVDALLTSTTHCLDHNPALTTRCHLLTCHPVQCGHHCHRPYRVKSCASYGS